MPVGARMKCVKYQLIVFNVVSFLCGLALILVGCLVQFAMHNTLIIKKMATAGFPIALIVVGAIICCVSIFGCCGAWKENYCMVTLFAVLLALITIAEVAAGVSAYFYRNSITSVAEISLTEMINNYEDSPEDIQKGVDQMHQKFNCCGVFGPFDWYFGVGNPANFSLEKNITATAITTTTTASPTNTTEATNATGATGNVTEATKASDTDSDSDSGETDVVSGRTEFKQLFPDSCCINFTEGCGQLSDTNITGRVHEEGCLKVLNALFRANLLWVVVTPIIVAVVQAFGVVFGCLLMRSIRSGYEVM